MLLLSQVQLAELGRDTLEGGSQIRICRRVIIHTRIRGAFTVILLRRRVDRRLEGDGINAYALCLHIGTYLFKLVVLVSGGHGGARRAVSAFARHDCINRGVTVSHDNDGL